MDFLIKAYVYQSLHCSFQMITRDMFEDALADLSEDGIIRLTGRATIRVNRPMDLNQIQVQVENSEHSLVNSATNEPSVEMTNLVENSENSLVNSSTNEQKVEMTNLVEKSTSAVKNSENSLVNSPINEQSVEMTNLVEKSTNVVENSEHSPLVNSPTNEQSAEMRKHQEAIKNHFKNLILKKGKMQFLVLNYDKTWAELKELSKLTITKDMFHKAVKDLEADDIVKHFDFIPDKIHLKNTYKELTEENTKNTKKRKAYEDI